MINKVILHGRIANDLEVRATPSGKRVLSFALAVNGFGRDAPASFIDCVAFSETAQSIGSYFCKGKEIIVSGRIVTRSYEDKTGVKRKVTEAIIEQWDFCGGGRHVPSSCSEGVDEGVGLTGEGCCGDINDGELPF